MPNLVATQPEYFMMEGYQYVYAKQPSSVSTELVKQSPVTINFRHLPLNLSKTEEESVGDSIV